MSFREKKVCTTIVCFFKNEMSLFSTTEIIYATLYSIQKKDMTVENVSALLTSQHNVRESLPIPL
jgi:hypothetical protein